jgi:hypothetical protein
MESLIFAPRTARHGTITRVRIAGIPALRSRRRAGE